MRIAIHTALTTALLSAQCAWAADPDAPVFTDAEQAGIDFELQGEYLGEVQGQDGTQTVGVQVIALGDGKFRFVAHVGGLPGDGWSRGAPKHTTESRLDGESVTFADESGRMQAVLTSGKITVLRDDEESGQLDKVVRKSPTLGAEPPPNALVLFNGQDTNAWDNGQIINDQYLGSTNVSTRDKFGDHHLHVEFRTPFMPASTGQARGNSGVYLQSRYEVQILDSFGLEGKNNECGGIYSIAEPAVNMCLAPLSWQTYDIDFTAAHYDEDGEKTQNARVTVRHNGVVIHDDVELTHGTPGRHPEGPGPDAVFLQDHGNPVVFRNIWLVKK